MNLSIAVSQPSMLDYVFTGIHFVWSYTSSVILMWAPWHHQLSWYSPVNSDRGICYTVTFMITNNMQPSHPQALGLCMGCRKWQADSCSIYMYKPTVATTYDTQNFISVRRVATKTACVRKGKSLLCMMWLPGVPKQMQLCNIILLIK